MKTKLLLVTALILLFATATAFAAPCPLSTVSPSVTICTPTNGATVTSPVNIVAGTTDTTATITAMAIYVDNNLATKQNVNQINASINMSAGNHYVVVQAWDSAGRIPKTAINITVSTATPAPTISFSASPSSITSGQSSTLSWTTTNATTVSIDQGIGAVATSGTRAVSPTTTTTYTITATGSGGTKTATATVTVGSGTSAPTISFSASPTSITTGQSSTLTWSTTNATSVSIDQGIGAVGTSGTRAVSPTASTTYTLTATGPGGTTSATAAVSVGSTGGTCTPSGATPSVTICAPANNSTVASPVHFQAAGISARPIVAWAVYVDNTLVFKQNVTSVDTNITMSTGKHYVVAQFWDNAGAVTKGSENITVGTVSTTPTLTLSASPTTINSGQSSTLTWSSTNVSTVTINNGVGTVSPSGAVTVSPTTTTTYTATGTATDGVTKVTATATVTVGSTSGAPTVTLTANPLSITAGQSSTLTWSSTNATSVSIDNGIGTVATSGSKTVAPTTTTTYTITATGSGGSATAKATVTVGTTPTTCTAASPAPSITICSPTNGSTVASPVHVLATPNSNTGVVAMAVYFDNTLVYKANVNKVDTLVNTANGSHYIVVQYWDNAGAVPAKASVNITVNPAAAGITFTASPTLINKGQSSTLTWNAPNATSVSIDNGVGSVPISGSTTVAPTVTTTYTLTATSSTGTQMASTTVSVSGTTPTDGIGKINHIIFMLQENRSFDNYFGMINKYRAQQGLPQDVDAFTLNSSGVPTNSESNYANNGRVTVFHMLSMCTENLSPSWNESHVSANRFNPSSNTFLNDGILYVAAKNAIDTGEHDTQGLRAMGYYDQTDLPYYYFMASQFSMSDRWFSPASANTNPNRHYMYAATSDGHAYPWTGAASTSPTIWDRLTAAGITWAVYVADFNDTVFYEFANAQNYGDHIFPMQKYFDDLAAGTLPQVVTLETNGLNEHPENNVQAGAAFVKSAVDALMGSKYWTDSAFILTYDEFGGLYDHVTPRLTVSPDGKKPIDLKTGDVPGDFTRTGFRVPMTVISPYSKPHYVSHTSMDHTAILKFIEERFALPSLNARDAAQPDMSEFFDFTNKPWATPPQAPAQPTSGPCYFDHLP